MQKNFDDYQSSIDLKARVYIYILSLRIVFVFFHLFCCLNNYVGCMNFSEYFIVIISGRY